MRRFRYFATGAGILVALGLFASPPSWSATFTGPTSPYYLDNWDTQEIFIVQGTSVINSFPWAYGTPCSNNCEGTLAVTNVVSTTWFGLGYGGTATGGQYSLSGTPTGTSWTGTPPLAGETFNYFYDGTSDRTHNYTVEYENSNGTENVIATDLNWQNPTVLFFLGVHSGAWLGIAYDPQNNSLWLSGWNMDTIADYSLSGALLSSFTTGLGDDLGSLGFDPADGTLWLSFAESSALYQYSTSGALLQSGTPAGLPGGDYLAGDFAEGAPTTIPEPGSLALFGFALASLAVWRRHNRHAAPTL